MKSLAAPVRSWLAAMVLVTFLSLPAVACLWDSDTLRDEARNLPEAVNVLTGRFERNPPLYYEMRLKRVTAEIERDPARLELYDDAGVACDRLQRADEAIEWMARKRQQLDKLGPPPKPPVAPFRDGSTVDHWYRYYANLGTFHAHRWVRGNRDRAKMEDMSIGRDLIANAIAINRNAHFGRERYQLTAMDWILQAPMDRHGKAAVPFMEGNKSAPEEAVRGLLGLIVLGDAWRSVDVHAALAAQFEYLGHSTLSMLADYRRGEIIDAGGRSIHPMAPGDPIVLKGWAGQTVMGRETTHAKEIATFYPEARAAADRWAANREAFMLAKLNAGKHPDTDKDFWTGYVEEPALSLPAMGMMESAVKKWEDNAMLITGLILAGIAAFVGWFVLRARRKAARVASV